MTGQLNSVQGSKYRTVEFVRIKAVSSVTLKHAGHVTGQNKHLCVVNEPCPKLECVLRDQSENITKSKL
jgi:hypothetical protein